MADSFGSPNAGDTVARVEKLISGVEDRANQLFDRVATEVAPRAIGSVKTPPQDEFREYVLTVAQAQDPQAAGMERMRGWASQYGWPVARTMFTEYVERNEKRLQEMGNG